MRSYGRQLPEQVRYPHIALDVLGQCHSSACVEIGNTRVICAVQHPQQLVDEYRGSRGRVACTLHRAATAGGHASHYTSAYSSHSNSNSTSTPEKDMALALEGVAEQAVVLEALPQLLLEVVVEVVADDGAVWDAAALALSAALASGGFAMREVVVACGAALRRSDAALLLDPDALEAATAPLTAVACVGLSTGAICYSMLRGACEPATATALLEAAVQGCLARRTAIMSQLQEAAVS